MKSLKRQSGATLVVALVILVLLALFGLSAYQTSTTELKSSGNMQARDEALNAAQQAIAVSQITVGRDVHICEGLYARECPLVVRCSAQASTMSADHTRHAYQSRTTGPLRDASTPVPGIRAKRESTSVPARAL